MQNDEQGHTMSEKGAFRPRDEAGVGFPADRTALLVIDPVNDVSRDRPRLRAPGSAAVQAAKRFWILNRHREETCQSGDQ